MFKLRLPNPILNSIFKTFILSFTYLILYINLYQVNSFLNIKINKTKTRSFYRCNLWPIIKPSKNKKKKIRSQRHFFLTLTIIMYFMSTYNNRINNL